MAGIPKFERVLRQGAFGEATGGMAGVGVAVVATGGTIIVGGIAGVTVVGVDVRAVANETDLGVD